MMFLMHPYAQKRTRFTYVTCMLFMVIGMFSMYFHMTLSFLGQLLDEISILWFLASGYSIWLPRCYFPAFVNRSRNHFVYLVFITTVVSTFLTFLRPTVNAYALNSIALHILYLVFWEYKKHISLDGGVSCQPYRGPLTCLLLPQDQQQGHPTPDGGLGGLVVARGDQLGQRPCPLQFLAANPLPLPTQHLACPHQPHLPLRHGHHGHGGRKVRDARGDGQAALLAPGQLARGAALRGARRGRQGLLRSTSTPVPASESPPPPPPASSSLPASCPAWPRLQGRGWTQVPLCALLPMTLQWLPPSPALDLPPRRRLCSHMCWGWAVVM
ncbi:alkaline ceramidase 1 isoform X2 [Erinaceus europaeus]|nr:alkaline ceramidase 1 isoform X2 [Erinaceus europaeus]XP_060037514.1 alkaline ceramidase 1 isoform X2 [Erinaceus europaeus]